MALHSTFPSSPYEILTPDVCWFPAAKEMRARAYEKLLPPLVANIRREALDWRDSGYVGESPTSIALLKWWLETDRLVDQAEDTQSQFQCYSTDWVEYWAVDFDYEKRKEIIKVPVGTGLGGIAALPGFELSQGEMPLPQFEERWTGGYIFENEWQSFRTRQNRELELKTTEHTYELPGRYTVAVKVIDIFGNDTMTLVPVNVA